MAVTKEQILNEYVRCINDTPYALKTYLQTYDNTVSQYVPLELFEDQLALLNDYDNYNENIALKYRQAGVSTVTAAWASKILAFANKKKPEKILIIANKLDTAVEMANKVRGFLEQWPKWVDVKFSAEKNSQRHFKLGNGCEVKAVATSKDALRGYTPTILIFDEAAYIEADSDFWAACMASLSTGGKVIVISTPNGFDPIYYEIYDQALRKMNEFKITEMLWFKDPRYSKDLKLLKIDDIIHYYLNREDYKVVETIDYSEIPPRERNFDEIRKYIAMGYRPSSTWYENMVKKLKYDRRKVSQELENNFLGSGDNVFESNMMQRIKQDMIQEPYDKLMSGAAFVWKQPIVGHKYICGVDVSRGDSEDFTSIQIIDFDDREQVFEYVGKIPPDIAAEIAYKWAKMYSAYIVVDITGGMGVSTSRKLQEMGYKDLYIDGVELGNKWKYDPKSADKIPGINFNNKRVQIISAFEEALRHGFKIRSNRLFNEMNTFIYINGRPDHQKGHHDDLIMAISMAIYVGENSFTQLTKVTEQTKALLNSWDVVSNENAAKEIQFNPNVPQGYPMYGAQVRNEPSVNDYKQYSWLFGKMY
jgi:hypothetical protein